jgi:hypothetical protein
MISRKTLFILILSIGAFTAIYLYYIKQQRAASIISYFPDPKLGDIYKMQKETDEGVTVFYLKIKDIGAESIYFYPGRLMAGAIHDNFLKHFDSTGTTVFTKKELADIKDGKWKVPAKDDTQLLEIERK